MIHGRSVFVAPTRLLRYATVRNTASLATIQRRALRTAEFDTSGKLMSLLTNNERRTLLEQLPEPGSRVVVGMSGGVDSSVSAALLVELGCYDVTGCWMKNWDIQDEAPTKVAVCSQEKDWEDALHVAQDLNIKIVQKDFCRDYWLSVWEPCLKEYSAGRTPNPDILCNREIKFGAFLDSLVEEGFDYVATGHYARLSVRDKFLLRGLDPNKDQSYFLSGVLPSAFRRACFPVGVLAKPRVKMLAAAAGFQSVVAKPESQGVCFIGERGSQFSHFLEEYMENQSGRFINAEDGRDLGPHRGLLNYTVGQRARVSGKNKPFFVAQKRGADVLIAPGHDHPALLADFVIVRFETKLFEENALERFHRKSGLECQVRYRGEASPCSFELVQAEGKGILLKVNFKRPEFSVAEGQTLTLYERDRCLGGGEILKVHRPYFDT